MDRVVARDPNEYFDDETGSKIFFYHEEYFYFRGDLFHAYMKDHFMDVSLKKLSDVLSTTGLLKTRGKENLFLFQRN